MIDRLLEIVARRVPAADAVGQIDRTTTVLADAAGVREVQERVDQRRQLRLFDEGRMGFAGSSYGDDDTLVESAVRSLALGDRAPALLPAPAALPDVVTAAPAAEGAGLEDLTGLAQQLARRLEGAGRTVSTWVEHSAGSVRVANTRGVLAQYEVTLVGLGATVTAPGVPMPCRIHLAETALPGEDAIERIADEVAHRIETPAWPGTMVEGPGRVIFGPRAVAMILRPLRAALRVDEIGARDNPLAGTIDQRFDPRITLSDDPWVSLRPGSRPIDDEGVVTRPVPLVDQGRVAGRIADLLGGAAHALPSTGHGRRSGGEAARAGYSNVRMAPGAEGMDQLLALVGEGLYVADLELCRGRLVSGGFVARARWAFRVEGGTVTGRVDGVDLEGNLFALLNRVIGIGNDAPWVGAHQVPALALDEVEVHPRG